MHKYSLSDLKDFAEKLAFESVPPISILLYGNLGAGKTTFSKFFVESIRADSNQKVTSPTFNIVQIYETSKGPLWHVDLYRLKSEEELFELGIFEAMNENICLIEWPQILEPYVPKYKTLRVDL